MTQSNWRLASLLAIVAMLTLCVCPVSILGVWRVFFYKSPGQRMVDDFAEGIEKAKKQPQGSDEFDKVIRHAWWAKIDRETLGEIIDYVIDTDTDGMVVITENGKSVRCWALDRDGIHPVPRNDYIGLPFYESSSLPSPHFCIPVDLWRKRPTRAEVLAYLIVALDSAEHRDGSFAKRSKKSS